MKRRCIKSLLKAAPAALTLVTAPAYADAPARALPPLPDVQSAYEASREAYRDLLPQTPLLLKGFLADYPESILAPEVSLMLADWYFYNREYPSALKVYETLGDSAFSGDIREGMLYRKAYALLKCGYYPEATVIFSSLAHSGSYGEPAKFYIAYIKYVNGDYDAAYEAFMPLRKSKIKGEEVDYYLNQIDFRRGEYRKVANASERLLVGNIPDELKAESIRVGALSFFKLGDKTTARNMLRRYVDLAGDGAEISAVYALATIYYDEGDYASALPLFSSVTDYPGDVAQSAWLYIGQIYMQQGDPSAAAIAFDKASRQQWNGEVAETATFNLAVNAATGPSLPFSDSTALMESFIETYPDSPYARTLSKYLANAYYEQKNYDEALRQIERVGQPDANTKAMRQKILYQLGASRLRQGNPRQAVEFLTEASAASQPDAEVAAQSSLWLGDALYSLGDFTRAASAYNVAVSSGKLGENTDIANYNLGYSLLKKKDYKGASKAFAKATKGKNLSAPQLIDARLRQADCLYYTGSYNEALSIFREVKLNRGQEGAFAAIREADILGRNGQVEQKIAILQSVVDSGEAGIWKADALKRLADAYSEKGDDRKAAELYANVVAEGGSDNSQSFYSLAANAENLYEAGEYDAALKAYRLIENSGIRALYPSAVTGIMRTSTDNREIAVYAAKVMALPGIPSEDRDEAIYRGAVASLSLGGIEKVGAERDLRNLAQSSDRLWGARAAVDLAQSLITDGRPSEAEEVLLEMIDAGADEPSTLAYGYIALSDAYRDLGKTYLARLYLENLRDNYPGKEKEITDMISKRLKTLGNDK